ncbi:MAG: protein kinase [Micrococcales bacterium]|nr:protein kinase [Micrococcales bacterium]
MLSGEVLSRWLQQQAGSVVQGSTITVSPGGLLRVSSVADSVPVQVSLPVMHGGQAAVSRAKDASGLDLALRVQAVVSETDRARQMERLVSMVTVATAARERPDLYPATLPVHQSFVITVPGTQIPMVGAAPSYEVWCDVMAWCPDDLNDWGRTTGPRGLSQVLALFVPVMATVQAVHEHLGIVHRDITPNNVLVDPAGRLMLADWGIAHQIASDQTSTYTQAIGNRGFALPPEMLLGDPSVGRYTDAWYLGCLLTWMLTGDTPGPHHGTAWLPPSLPSGGHHDVVRTVITGLCAPDPRERLGLPAALDALYEGRAPAISVTPGGLNPAWGTAGLGPGSVPGPRDRSESGSTSEEQETNPAHRAYRRSMWMGFVLSVSTTAIVLGFVGWVVYKAYQDDAVNNPSNDKAKYVVWDGGTGPFDWTGQKFPPVFVFASPENLPRQITCDAWERKVSGTTLTERPSGRIDMEPLLLTEDVDVLVDVGAECGGLDVWLPPDMNWTVSWNGVREYGASPSMTITDGNILDRTTWSDGQQSYENVPRPGEPTLHLIFEARSSVTISTYYHRWNDGTGRFPMPDSYDLLRYYFPSPDELPREITCTKSQFSSLDLRQLELTEDVDVTLWYGTKCPTNTLLLSPDQNWTIEWSGTGSGELQVAADVGTPSGQTLAAGTQTLTNVVDPGAPMLHLSLNSATVVHVEPLRAAF